MKAIYNLVGGIFMIKTYKLNESEKWDEIVQTFSSYDIYYLAEHARLYQIHGDGEPMLIYYAGETCRGIKVVMIRDLADDSRFSSLNSGEYYDIATPYGYGGFLLEGKLTKEALHNLKQEYIDFCRTSQFISEFVVFHPLLHNVDYNKHIYDTIKLGDSISVDLSDQEAIWANYEASNRRNIKKALKADVKVYWGNAPHLFNDFKTLYKSTMDKDQATSYYYFDDQYYTSLMENLNKNFLVFYAVLDDKPIAMSIIYLINKKMHYHLSASDNHYNRLNPTNLLLHEVAMWGNEHGFDQLHLGAGLGGKEDQLFKFKQKFNKFSETEFVIGKKIYDQASYDELVELRKEASEFDEESAYFPLYRA